MMMNSCNLNCDLISRGIAKGAFLLVLATSLSGCFGGGPSEAEIAERYNEIRQRVAKSMAAGGIHRPAERIEVDLHGCSAVDNNGYRCRYILKTLDAASGYVEKQEEEERVWVQVYGKWQLVPQ